MSLLEQLSLGVKFAAAEAVSYSREWMDVAKLNAAINARKQEIESAFAELGRAVFLRESEDSEGPNAALCQNILSLQTELSELAERVVTLKEEGKAEREQAAADYHTASEALSRPEETAPSEETEEAEASEAPVEDSEKE